MEKDIKKILLSKEDLDLICKKLGNTISNDYKDKELVLIGVLNGCNPFMADLMRYITIPLNVDYIVVSSYHGKESSGVVNLKKDIYIDIENKDILIIEDIIDTGRTLQMISELFSHRKANSVEVCCLLDKPEGRVIDFNAKYVGTSVPKEFVVGYGLDYNEYYRNLPYVGVLKEEIYTK